VPQKAGGIAWVGDEREQAHAAAATEPLQGRQCRPAPQLGARLPSQPRLAMPPHVAGHSPRNFLRHLPRAIVFGGRGAVAASRPARGLEETKEWTCAKSWLVWHSASRSLLPQERLRRAALGA
jgi:hypothetical protein